MRALEPVSIPLKRLQSAEVLTHWIRFSNLPGKGEHVAVVYGEAGQSEEAPLVRIHSKCLTGDVFHAQNCDCGAQLEYARVRMEKEGGILLYLDQEGRGIGLYKKLAAVLLQQNQGLDTYQANIALGHDEDERDFTIAGLMLKALGVDRVRLLTGNPDKVAALTRMGIAVDAVITPPAFETAHNRAYLTAKRGKGHHIA